jgi:hypothetical protein
MRFTAVVGTLFCCLLLAVVARADEVTCGSLDNALGPFSYYDTSQTNILRNVESNHLNMDVQMLRRGQTTTLPIGDLDYALRVFPNHPRALNLVSQYEVNGGRMIMPLGTPAYSAECFFDRAMRFVPKDPTVRMLLGLHYMRQKRWDVAEKAMLDAQTIAPQNREVQYNLGLLYLETKQPEKALAMAHKAYAQPGAYPLPGLRRRLERAGAWRDLPATPTAPADGSVAPAAPVVPTSPGAASGAPLVTERGVSRSNATVLASGQPISPSASGR